MIDTLGERFAETFIALPAEGTRGGILLAVNDVYYKIALVELEVHSVTAKIIAEAGAVEWTITVVYGAQEDNEKLQFLEEDQMDSAMCHR